MKNKLRFAPSPTGYLHIGNARTVILNYLFIKSINGEMLLRIDDTDIERSRKEFDDAIIEDLDWLGIKYNDLIRQSDRSDKYDEAANILKKIVIKTEALMGFEIFLDNLKVTKKSLNDQKPKYETSDFQKSERDFAFVVDKSFKASVLENIIKKLDENIIKKVTTFDVFEGQNIPEGKKSIAINVVMQAMDKTLTEKDLDQMSEKIINTVRDKTGSTIRS